MATSRRSFFGFTSALLAPWVLSRSAFAADPALTTPTPPAPPTPPTPPTPPAPSTSQSDPYFPSHPPERAREFVGAAHGNVARVKELLAKWPTLSRACYDWGYGDWEDALGAASHTGNREIAALLIAAGARPTLFSATMLGQVEVVEAFVAAAPGIEATPGPHGISLLRHAEVGGEGAAAVLAFLKTLPGADRRPTAQPISKESLAALCGSYVYGSAADEKLVVELNGENLTVARPGRFGRNLTNLGERTFFPAGAVEVRIRFTEVGGNKTVSVFDPDLVVAADKLE